MQPNDKKRFIMKNLKLTLNVLLSVLIASCSSAQADQNPDVGFVLSKDTYVVNNITKETSEYLCLKAKVGDTIIVNSRGGSVYHANVSGKCINDKGIKVVVVYAMSAAPFLSMYSKNICTFDSTMIGVHSPYIPNVELPDNQLRKAIIDLVVPVTLTEGYNLEDTLFLAGVIIITRSSTMSSIPILKYNEILGKRN